MGIFQTKIFGRGTDFICCDQNVISNGGMQCIPPLEIIFTIRNKLL